MKKIIIAAFIVIVSSCNKSNDPASKLINEDMKRTLVNPDSYQALETSTDSAFAPEDNPLLFNKVMEYAKDTVAIESLTDAIAKMKKEKENAGTALGMCKISNVGADEYEKMKTYYDACDVQISILQNKHDSIASTLEDKLTGIKELLKTPRTFIGFKSIHYYKAKNKENDIINDSCYYLFDKGMTKTVYSMPLATFSVLNEMINSVK